MKKIAILAFLALTPSLLYAQEEPTSIAPTEDLSGLSEAYAKATEAFNKLPKETQQAYFQKREDAVTLFSNKRIFESLEATQELEKMFTPDPQVINLRGACYMELRDFAKCKTEFERVREITGANMSVLFNLAEVSFVSHDWASALSIYEEMLKTPDAKKYNMFHLVEFKEMLCHIGLSKVETLSGEERAMHAAKAKELSTKYDYTADTPYYYYAQAAYYYSQDDEVNGLKLLDQGRRVYVQSAHLLTAWEDTLSEFGYIRSIYINDQEDSTTPE